MDFSVVAPTFLITLREGVEAALIVGIVLAYLKKAKRSQLNIWVYVGIGAGILVSALIGILFGWILQAMGALSPAGEAVMEGVFSVLAIVLLSWMLVWMTQQARSMKGMVEGEVAAVLKQDSAAAWGIFSLIFVAVLREGFETVVFITAKFQQGLLPALGALAGLAVAAGIGVLMFRWGVKINLRLFFQVMGALLLLIISGLVVTALGHFDAVMQTLASQNRASQSLCFYYEHFTRVHSCVLGSDVWDLSKVLPEDEFPGLLLSALFGYTQRLYQVQAIAYLLFLFTIGSLYFQSLSGRAFFRPSRASKL
ncbi:FTR1 family iron permease [Microcoleus sp. FACHB-1515]|uniref:FTR1 family iron permease n=1 Tax=Cyanophyceae TaxID=3028117 RepID=UPI0016849067|nr:FTR1 family protein [Microcoleus sp. FACHB-1515]MBD2089470.1 FTR1 family iron permease [Microcoleus sp. FACHB-1515]